MVGASERIGRLVVIINVTFHQVHKNWIEKCNAHKTQHQQKRMLASDGLLVVIDSQTGIFFFRDFFPFFFLLETQVAYTTKRTGYLFTSTQLLESFSRKSTSNYIFAINGTEIQTIMVYSPRFSARNLNSTTFNILINCFFFCVFVNKFSWNAKAKCTEKRIRFKWEKQIGNICASSSAHRCVHSKVRKIGAKLTHFGCSF